MIFNRARAQRFAQAYIGSTAELNLLGWGVGGYVFVAPDYRTAIKVHHYPDGYATELKTYRLLKQLKILRLHGLAVPQLHGHDDDALIIQMDIVQPPFLLDFAGVRFSPPDFTADTMQHWHREIAERFGNNTDLVYAVYHTLARHGIYYMDFRPTNLKVEGLLDLDLSSDDDDSC